jgi:hypothetical protein
VKSLCDTSSDWNVAYEKKTVRVWTKPVDDSSLQMIKATSFYSDISADVMYDVLQDPIYRPNWDKYMLCQYDIGMLNPNNDLCYYALGGIPPFRSRDFVLQRSWLDTGDEKYICGHSVCHDKYPPGKAHVRATVYLTAYFVRSMGEHSTQVTYLTHSDPKGKLPSWFVNRLSKVIAPKLFKKLHKAALNYTEWKKNHNPFHKPWRFPEQQENCPRVNLTECLPRVYSEVILDETAVSLKDVKDDDVE